MEAVQVQKREKREAFDDDLIVLCDSENHRIVLIENTSGNVYSTIGKEGIYYFYSPFYSLYC